MSIDLPFVTGVAMATRDPAEVGHRRAAELGCTHFYLDLNNRTDTIDQWPPERVAELLRAMGTSGLRAIIHGSLADPVASELPEPRATGIERVQRELDLAEQVGAPLIMHASSYYPGRSEPLRRDEALAAFAASAAVAERAAAERGVGLWLENLPKLDDGHVYDAVFARPAEYRRVLGEVDAPMVLDVGHAHVNAGPRDMAFDDLFPRIAALCLSDNDGTSDQHGPLGSGTIDFGAVLDQIERSGWRGIVAFEMVGSDPAEAMAHLDELWSARAAAAE